MVADLGRRASVIASVSCLAECVASPSNHMAIPDLEAEMGTSERFLEDCSPFLLKLSSLVQKTGDV